MAGVFDDYISAFEDTTPTAVMEAGFAISVKRLESGQWLAAARGTGCLSGFGATEAEARAAVRKVLRRDFPAARTIEKVLLRHYGTRIELPPVQALVMVGVQFAQFASEPWPDCEGARWTKRARLYNNQRRILENAARVLGSDLERLRPSEFSDRRQELERAIATLKAARGATHPEIADVSQHGPPMRGCTFCARELARWLAPPLRGLDVLVSTRKTSAFVKSLRDLLALIYGEEKAPSCSAISQAIAKFDAKN